MGKIGRLEWEWAERDGEITIRKKKGRITVKEIFDFFGDRDAIYYFGEGTMFAIVGRIRADTYQGFEMAEQEGDAVDVWILGDESQCFCGRVLHTSFCPECGAKLI